MFVAPGFVASGCLDGVVRTPHTAEGAHAPSGHRPDQRRGSSVRKQRIDRAAIVWDSLSEPAQLELAGAALRRAAEIIARQAEALAEEIEAGTLQDQGGPEALRLLAGVVRATCDDRITNRDFM